MRAVIFAALAAGAAAQLGVPTTTVDWTGETIVISVTTDALGRWTTQTISTVGAVATTTSLDDTGLGLDTTTTDLVTTPTRTTTQHGNVAAPTSTNGEPMTRTVYWYPDPADPEAEWLSATWTDSFIPATSPTPVTAGTIAETVASVSGVTAAADSAQVQTTNGAISRAAPAVGAVVAAVLAAAL